VPWGRIKVAKQGDWYTEW